MGSWAGQAILQCLTIDRPRPSAYHPCAFSDRGLCFTCHNILLPLCGSMDIYSDATTPACTRGHVPCVPRLGHSGVRYSPRAESKALPGHTARVMLWQLAEGLDLQGTYECLVIMLIRISCQRCVLQHCVDLVCHNLQNTTTLLSFCDVRQLWLPDNCMKSMCTMCSTSTQPSLAPPMYTELYPKAYCEPSLEPRICWPTQGGPC